MAISRNVENSVALVSKPGNITSHTNYIKYTTYISHNYSSKGGNKL